MIRASDLWKPVTVSGLLAIPVVLTVVPAAYLGSRVSHRVPVLRLRRILALLISAAAVRIWISVLYS